MSPSRKTVRRSACAVACAMVQAWLLSTLLAAPAVSSAEAGAARPPEPRAASTDLIAPAAGATSERATEPGEAATAGAAGDGSGPDFGFADLQGGGHTLAQERGQVVLLEFWASWCVPCRKGFPFLDQLQARYEAGGFRVVAVTLEADDVAVLEFVSRHPVRFLVGRDPSGRAGELYQVGAMPTAILLDRDGRIVGRFEGGSETVHHEIEETVDTVMRGEAPAHVFGTRPHDIRKSNLRAWERGYLADPIMELDGDQLTRSMREHVHSSKEAAAGDGGVAGGGCGCN